MRSLYELTDEDADLDSQLFHASLMPSQERRNNPHYQDVTVMRIADRYRRVMSATPSERWARRRVLAFWGVLDA